MSSAYLLGVCAALLIALPCAIWRTRDDTLRIRLAIVVVVAGLSIGTISHIQELVLRGPIPRPQQPLAFNLFWTSLTLLDPLAAVLVLLARRAGVVLVVAIMVADIAVNTSAFGSAGGFPLMAQILYGVFVFATAPALWRSC